MQIIHHITMDLARGLPQLPLDAVQGDGNTRKILLTLLEDGKTWNVPEGVTAAVAFRKADGKKGLYDALPHGAKAVTVTGNTVTAMLAPQVLTCPGEVSAAVVFHNSALDQLATFPFAIRVKANPAAGQEISNDYYRYSTMEQVSEAVEAALASLEAEKQEFLSKAEEALQVVHNTAAEDAPAIVCEAAGESVTVTDAAERPLKGLSLYGKTVQNGTPTPSSPVPLVSAGASGAINTTVCGKNLYDLSKGWNINTLQSVNIPAGASVTIAAYPSVCASQFNAQIVFVDGTKKNLALFDAASTTKKWYTKIYPCEKQAVAIGFYDVKPTAPNTIDKVLVCLGSISAVTDADWEAYDGGSVTASTLGGLPGIPVSSGGNYTDESGQAWICDEVDFARGVYVQRTNVWTADENAQFVQHMLTNQDYFVCVATSSKLGANRDGFCNLLPVAKDAGEGLQTSACLLIGTASTPLHFSVPTSIANSVSSFKKWAIDNSLCVVYTAKEPIETPLSAVELAQYAALHSNKPTTNIFNDGGAGMKLSYVADTKSYIDRQITAVSKAILG